MKSINLAKTQLSDSCGEAWNKCIFHNHTLTQLILEDNKFSPAVALDLFRHFELSLCSSLTVFKLLTTVPSSVEAKLSQNQIRQERTLKNPNEAIIAAIKSIKNGNLDLGYVNLISSQAPIESTSVIEVYLDHCNITKIPLLSDFKQVTKLILCGNNLTGFPNFILIPNLKVLDLSNNKISKLPSSTLKHLQTLEVLSLANNVIFNISPNIKDIPSLKKLFLQGNFIYRLPNEIFELTNLEDLRTVGNPMPKIYHKLYQAWVTKVSELNLSDMGLEELPSEIQYLTNLTSLLLTDNKLTTLIPQINALTKLKKLNLKGNPIDELPWQVGNLAQLQELEWKDLQKEDVASLRKLLVLQKDTSKKSFRRVKLMIVGRDNVGKTTIRQCLV